MVMPEIGFEEEPISPVSREETVTNRNPNTRIMTAPRNPCTLMPRPSAGHHDEDHADAAGEHDHHGQVAIGAGGRLLAAGAGGAEVAQAGED